MAGSKYYLTNLYSSWKRIILITFELNINKTLGTLAFGLVTLHYFVYTLSKLFHRQTKQYSLYVIEKETKERNGQLFVRLFICSVIKQMFTD